MVRTWGCARAEGPADGRMVLFGRDLGRRDVVAFGFAFFWPIALVPRSKCQGWLCRLCEGPYTTDEAP
jgi:hypothetical protein